MQKLAIPKVISLRSDDAASVLAQLSEPFPTDSISWRVGAMTADQSKGIGLAYIDARDVMDRLDKVVGCNNWQCRYTQSHTATVCEIGIAFDGEWVWKADGGGESDIEAEKGALSGAFKRAAVRWGVGRYLYSLGNVWVPLDKKRFTADAVDQLNRHYHQFITRMGWGGETEGPVVADIVRFFKAVIEETVKAKSDALEFIAKNEGVIKTLPKLAQTAINDALRPHLEK